MASDAPFLPGSQLPSYYLSIYLAGQAVHRRTERPASSAGSREGRPGGKVTTRAPRQKQRLKGQEVSHVMAWTFDEHQKLSLSLSGAVCSLVGGP